MPHQLAVLGCVYHSRNKHAHLNMHTYVFSMQLYLGVIASVPSTKTAILNQGAINKPEIQIKKSSPIQPLTFSEVADK